MRIDIPGKLEWATYTEADRNWERNWAISTIGLSASLLLTIISHAGAISIYWGMLLVIYLLIEFWNLYTWEHFQLLSVIPWVLTIISHTEAPSIYLRMSLRVFCSLSPENLRMCDVEAFSTFDCHSLNPTHNQGGQFVGPSIHLMMLFRLLY